MDFDVSHLKRPYPIAEYTDSESDEGERGPQKPLQANLIRQAYSYPAKFYI